MTDMIRKKKKDTNKPIIRTPTGIEGIHEPEAQPQNGIAGTLLLIHSGANLAIILMMRAWPALAERMGYANLQSWVIRTLIMQGAFIFLPAAVILLVSRFPAEMVVGRRAAPGSLFLAVTIGIPAAVVFQGLNNLFLYVLIQSGIRLPVIRSSNMVADTDLLSRPWIFIAFIVLITAVIPAVVEELFFRGVLFASLRSGGALVSAAVWQAIAFALFHADPLFLLPPFLTGLLLAFIRHQCGRLWPAMLTHFSLNLSLIALTPLLPRLTQSMLLDQSQHTTSLLYASLIAACIAAVGLIPLIILIANLKPDGKQYKKKFVVFPGDWKFALAIVLLIVTIMLTYSVS